MKTMQLWMFLLAGIVSHTQQLSIGDSVPDIQLDNVYNYTSDSLRLSDFRGKLIIFDFWGPYCTPCFAGFPKLDSLQQEFGDKIQVIAVGRESKESVDLFFKKKVKVKKPRFPFITSDSILRGMFVHNNIPAHVWIDTNGKVLFLADFFYATKENVEKILARENIEIPVYAPRKRVETLFDSAYVDELKSYNYLARCEPSRLFRSPYKFRDLLTYNCLTPVQLIQQVYSEMCHRAIEFKRPGRTIIEPASAEKPMQPSSTAGFNDWQRMNAYNYQSLCKDCDPAIHYRKMIDDLESRFDFETVLETRLVPSYVLVKTGPLTGLATKGGVPENHLLELGVDSEAKDSIRFVRNAPFTQFSNLLKVYIEGYFGPFKNDVKYEGNIDLQINGDVFDAIKLPGLRRELQHYNLDLVVKKTPVRVLVIRYRKRYV